jgi:hypothetical protein
MQNSLRWHGNLEEGWLSWILMKIKKKKRPAIGDIIEIRTPKGLAFAQFSHNDPDYGSLIRILPGVFDRRPNAFADLVRSEERFHIFFPLRVAVSRGIVEIVGTEPVPERDQRMPLMRVAGARDRSGKVLNWWLRDGEREWPVESLTADQQRLL